jgi:general secretion pathway protein G
MSLGMMLRKHKQQAGFTLMELLVVMVILGLLLSIAAPRYFDSVESAKEAALRTNLRLMREAIDKFRADTGQYPATLDQLATRRYLRAIPPDPVTDSEATWVVVPHPDGLTPGVYDVHSGATGIGRDGRPLEEW